MKKLFLVLLFIPLISFGQTAEDFFNSGKAKDSLEDFKGAISDYSKAIAIFSDPEFYNNRLLSMRSSSDEYKLFMKAGIDSFYRDINLFQNYFQVRKK